MPSKTSGDIPTGVPHANTRRRPDRRRSGHALRRAGAIGLTLGLLALPGAAQAQSPSPSGPPSFEMAPGVSVQALALLQEPGGPSGQDAPGIFRFTFQPGSAADLSGQPEVALVTIESGTLVGSTDFDLVVHSPADQGAAGTPVSAGTDVTLEQGDYFLVPPGGAGHVRDDGDTAATMLVASLLPTSPSGGPQAAPSASPAS